VPARPITRRAMWTGFGLAGAAVILIRDRDRTAALPAADTESDADQEVAIVRFDDSGTNVGLIHVKRVTRPEPEWRELLTPQQYTVTRQQQTDPAFSGTLYRVHERGLFRCICCGDALFSSDAKYDSGTGWPSFWTPVANENLRTRQELFATLATGIEVICVRCRAHLGHVFNDGPPPTHLRYCINESSLHFVAHQPPS
jgi:peptide-methionine (R)-S-oxide reductase